MIEKTEFTGVNEAFEILFNAAGAENMNRATVSLCGKTTTLKLPGADNR